MGRFILILSAVLLSISLQAEAATLSWVKTPPSTLSATKNELTADYVPGKGKLHATSKFVFSVSEEHKYSVLITETLDAFLNMTVKLDGALLSFANGSWSFAGLLAPGKHTIQLAGSVLKKKQIIGVDITAVPVPAAIWLFGSAIVGLGFGGMSKRKEVIA